MIALLRNAIGRRCHFKMWLRHMGISSVKAGAACQIPIGNLTYLKLLLFDAVLPLCQCIFHTCSYSVLIPLIRICKQLLLNSCTDGVESP